MKKIRVALVGNPNVGKTSILNHLAGTNLMIGNWPGVTVEKRTGSTFFQEYKIEFIDLPGIYTLEEVLSEDEKITAEFLRSEEFDVLLNVVETPRLERDLYLTTQLVELRKPMVIALNMIDEAEKLGYSVDDKRLSDLLKIAVVKTVGRTGEGVKALLPAIVETYEKQQIPQLETLSLETLQPEDEREKRLFLVKGLSAEVLQRVFLPKRTITEFLDNLFLHPFFGFVFLFIILYVTFKLIFDISSPLVDFIDGFIQDFISPLVLISLENLGASNFISRMISEAVFGGLGMVFSFVPLIFVTYFFLTFLETSGYLPRVAFLMDRFTHKIGLHGQSIIPLILGFGCNVPAILATRTLQDRSDRLLIISMIPFMSCSARLVVFGFFAITFFENPLLIILALYLVGIFLSLFTAVLLRKSLLRKALSHFVMELPPYRFPSLRVLIRIVLLHLKSFIVRAGTIIFVISLIIWFSLNLPPGVERLEDSIAGKIGKTLSPLFEPIGLGDWRITTSLIPAFLAREAILTNLGVILKAEREETEAFDPKERLADQGRNLLSALSEIISSLLSPLPKKLSLEDEEEETSGLKGEIRKLLPLPSVLAFLFFVLIYNSCVATVVAMWREGSKNLALGFLFYSFLLAWFVSYIVYKFFS